MRQLARISLMSWAVLGQSGHPGTVVGRVVDGQSAQPLTDVQVALIDSSGTMRTSARITGSDGTFSFQQLRPGRYSVQAHRAGYAPGSYGQGHPYDLTGWFTVPQSTEVVVRLWKYGSFSGVVRDDDGMAVEGATVHAMRQSVVARDIRWAVRFSTRTNAHGQYSFANLPAGHYVVAAALPAVGNMAGRLAVFYPGVDSPLSAVPIVVTYGAERTGVDFAEWPSASVRVRGVIRDREGTPVSLPLLLSRVDPSLTPSFVMSRVRSSADGAFSFDRVPPGQYVIRAWQFPDWPSGPGFHAGDRAAVPTEPLAATPTEASQWAEEQVSVGASLPAPLALHMKTGFTVSGRVTFDGTSPPPTEAMLRRAVVVRPTDGRELGNFPVARIDPDGSFTTVGLPAGQYALGLSRNFDGWAIDSVRVGSLDFAGKSFDLGANISDVTVRLTRAATSLVGQIRDASNRLRTDATAFVFSSDASSWIDPGSRVQGRAYATKPDGNGEYRMQVYPGTYYVSALIGPLPDNWAAPDFLKSLIPYSVRIELASGSTTTINVVAVEHR